MNPVDDLLWLWRLGQMPAGEEALMLGDVDIAVVHGREVAYRYTPGTGSPILLIHGIGSSMSTWTSIPERLEAAGHGVLAVDLQGHGESSLDPGDFSLGAHANTLRELLDLLVIDTVHLVGHSLGAASRCSLSTSSPSELRP